MHFKYNLLLLKSQVLLCVYNSMTEETIIVKKKAGRPKKEMTPEQLAMSERAKADAILVSKGLFSPGDRHNKYRFVKDTLLRTFDVQTWEEEKFLAFLSFLDSFYEVVYGKGKLAVTVVKIQLLEQKLSEFPDNPTAEFMWRVNRWSEPFDGDVHKKFYIRVANMMRIVFGYLKQNPAVITDAIKEHCKGKIQYEWILTNTRIVTTKMGATVVEHDPTGFTGNSMQAAGYANADKVMLDSILKVANVYDMIASGITKKDIEKLNVKDKINALQKLSFIHTVTKNFKPNNNTFKQINIYKAGAQELEAALLDFTKQE